MARPVTRIYRTPSNTTISTSLTTLKKKIKIMIDPFHTDLAQNLRDAFEKLTKWRNVFAGWQLGTRSKEDPECQAVKDHREVTMLLRAEVNALTKLLIDKQVCTVVELQKQMLQEATWLDKSYETKFPGFTTSEVGVHIDTEKAKETTKNWKP